MKRVDVSIHDSGCLLDKEQVATIGFFDGVHLGHRYLISQLTPEDGQESLVVTLDRHPKMLLHPETHPSVLSSLDVKMLLLSHTDVDNVAVLRFDDDMARLSARDFMSQVLRDRLNVRCLVLGYDNRFGRRKSSGNEGFADYVAYGREVGIKVLRAQEWKNNGQRVSSSLIRSYLEDGNIDRANSCLGYEYTVVGRVVRGYQEGRKIGFPTANIDTSEWGQMMPAAGVYAVRVRLKNAMSWRWGMMNIGTRPTYGGTEQTAEIHILDFKGDLYDDILLVKFVAKIREERAFESHEALATQLQEDRRRIESFKVESGEFGV